MTAKLLDDTPASLLVALRVSHADAETCAAKLSELRRRMARMTGYSSADVVRRNGGLGTDFYVIARFIDQKALNRWLSSPERKGLLGEVEDMAIADISREQAAGSNVWFEPIVSMPSAPKPPLLWKRWLLSFVAVYPALIILVNLMRPLTELMPEAVGLFAVALVLTGLTTAFIVPRLTKALQGWLGRR